MASKVIPAESTFNQKPKKGTTNKPLFKRYKVVKTNKTSSWKTQQTRKKPVGNSNDSKGEVHTVNAPKDVIDEVLAMFQKPTSWKALKAQIALANVMTKSNTVKLENADVWQHVPEVYRPCPKQE